MNSPRTSRISSQKGGEKKKEKKKKRKMSNEGVWRASSATLQHLKVSELGERSDYTDKVYRWVKMRNGNLLYTVLFFDHISTLVQLTKVIGKINKILNKNIKSE